MNLLAVAVGGAMGALMRYGITGWLQALTGSSFPLGTLAVNVVGSFVIGVVLQAGTERYMMAPETRLLLTTGLCGALTTFSTFAYESLRLLEEQQWAAAAGNIVLNVALCLLAVWLGVLAARMV